jgi:hypothetical protein
MLTKTAAADTPFKLIGNDLWLEYADVFVTTNSAYIGNITDQNCAIYANDIYTIPYPVNVFDLYFKNLTGGSNAVVTIIGTTLTRKKAAEYGLELPP